MGSEFTSDRCNTVHRTPPKKGDQKSGSQHGDNDTRNTMQPELGPDQNHRNGGDGHRNGVGIR